MMSDLWLSEDFLIAQYNSFESAGEKEKLLEIILPIYKKGFFFFFLTMTTEWKPDLIMFVS